MCKRDSVFGKPLLLLVPVLGFLGCAGAHSVLGTPTVVSGTAVDLPPEVTNPDEVRKAMLEKYPPLLRDAEVRGRAILRLFLDETGRVQQAALEESSRDQALDAMALDLGSIIRFQPARNGGEAVPVVITISLDLVPPPPVLATRVEIRRDEEDIDTPRPRP